MVTEYAGSIAAKRVKIGTCEDMYIMSILDQRVRCVEKSRNNDCTSCITAEERAEGIDQPCNCLCPVCVAAQTGTCQADRIDHLDYPECGQVPAYHVMRGRYKTLPHREWRLCESHALPDRDLLPAWRVIPLS